MKYSKIILGLIVLIYLISNANAFGVVNPANPVVVSIGQTKDIDLLIQNGAGATEDVITKIEILEGNNIVQLEKEEYLVPANKEVNAKLRINVPRDAKIGDKWNVKLSFKATPEGKEGMVSMGYGVVINFDVLTQQPAAEIPTGQITREVSKTNIYTAIAVIIIATILFFLLKRKKSIKKKK